MLASILIILVSTVLLVYWFRYTCILLLRGYAEQAQPDRRFSFGAVRERLRTETQLDPLHVALERDYQLITYLFRNAAGLELSAFEDRLLLWDYKLMQCWYRIARIAAPAHARNALSEMATVLQVLGGKLGERAGLNQEI
jgi:hypothetical protein